MVTVDISILAIHVAHLKNVAMIVVIKVMSIHATDTHFFHTVHKVEMPPGK